MDGGAWRAIVHSAAESRTGLKRLSTHTHTPLYAYIYIHTYTHTTIYVHLHIHMLASGSSTAAHGLESDYPTLLFDLDLMKADQGSLGTVTGMVGREGWLPGSDFQL